MGYGPTWVTSASPALAARAESRQAPAPLLPAPRNVARTGAKTFLDGCHQHPLRLGGMWGDRRCHQQPLGCSGAAPQHPHVPTLQDAAPMGAQGPPAHPEPGCWSGGGGVTALSVPHPLLSPTQGAPPRLGVTRCSLHGAVWVQPWHPQLSLTGAKRVPTHGGGRGLRREQLDTGWGGHGSVPGWAKGLGVLPGSLVRHLRLGTGGTTPRGLWMSPGSGTITCQTLTMMPQPSECCDRWREHHPDLISGWLNPPFAPQIGHLHPTQVCPQGGTPMAPTNTGLNGVF